VEKVELLFTVMLKECGFLQHNLVITTAHLQLLIQLHVVTAGMSIGKQLQVDQLEQRCVHRIIIFIHALQVDGNKVQPTAIWHIAMEVMQVMEHN